MTTLRPILVATDLSAPARHAVQRALLLASLAGCEAHILHALELDIVDSLHELLGANLATTKAALEADASERLAQLLPNVAGRHGVVARTRVVAGPPLAVIAGEADALDAVLVVLGERGESFLRYATLGSTAERLLRKSVRRPVLVVKQPPRESYRNVLVAVDFSPASRLAIVEARRWSRGSELVLLHAFELPFEGKLARAGVDEQVIRKYIDAGIETRRARLHELAASAGYPVPIELLLKASAAGAQGSTALATLRSARLVRTRLLRGSQLLECYHDRIREAVLDQLAPDKGKTAPADVPKAKRKGAKARKQTAQP